MSTILKLRIRGLVSVAKFVLNNVSMVAGESHKDCFRHRGTQLCVKHRSLVSSAQDAKGCKLAVFKRKSAPYSTSVTNLNKSFVRQLALEREAALSATKPVFAAATPRSGAGTRCGDAWLWMHKGGNHCLISRGCGFTRALAFDMEEKPRVACPASAGGTHQLGQSAWPVSQAKTTRPTLGQCGPQNLRRDVRPTATIRSIAN